MTGRHRPATMKASSDTPNTCNQLRSGFERAPNGRIRQTEYAWKAGVHSLSAVCAGRALQIRQGIEINRIEIDGHVDFQRALAVDEPRRSPRFPFPRIRLSKGMICALIFRHHSITNAEPGQR